MASVYIHLRRFFTDLATGAEESLAWPLRTDEVDDVPVPVFRRAVAGKRKLPEVVTDLCWKTQKARLNSVRFLRVVFGG